jgi:hypothetical protein
MSTIAENWRLIFFAEGDDAVEYLDLLDEEDESAAIDQILDTKLEDLDAGDFPEPEDEDELYEHSDGYVLVYNRPLERVWVYELMDLDEDEL